MLKDVRINAMQVMDRLHISVEILNVTEEQAPVLQRLTGAVVPFPSHMTDEDVVDLVCREVVKALQMSR